MKTAEWFACLDFGTFDILLPQGQVRSGSYVCSLKNLSLDRALAKLFGKKTACFPRRAHTLLSLEGGSLATGVPLSLLQLEESSFASESPFLSQHLGRLGITAIRFTDKKVQYVLNAPQFIKLWEGKK